jgi:hypothetical protein
MAQDQGGYALVLARFEIGTDDGLGEDVEAQLILKLNPAKPPLCDLFQDTGRIPSQTLFDELKKQHPEILKEFNKLTGEQQMMKMMSLSPTIGKQAHSLNKS